MHSLLPSLTSSRFPLTNASLSAQPRGRFRGDPAVHEHLCGFYDSSESSTNCLRFIRASRRTHQCLTSPTLVARRFMRF